VRRSVLAKLRDGTEILRAGGGTTLTAADCNLLLEAVAAAHAVQARPVSRIYGEVETWQIRSEDGARLNAALGQLGLQ
jgi:hypothetical protein